MSADTQTVLGPNDAASQHAFAHPDHIAADSAVLEFLLADAMSIASTSADEPTTVHIPTTESWHRRTQLPEPARLVEVEKVTIVGFFGRLGDNIDPNVARAVQEVSEELAESVFSVPGLLVYSSHQLADERNFANLVVVDSDAVVECWRSRNLHIAAATDLAPAYYEHVRIYNGTAEPKPGKRPRIDLTAIKYWDYRCDPTWRAMRRFETTA
ncbi:MAG: hypothetical protein HKN07_11355 [Acidimicrobiia bacterium]|nr:hypothetical protein [Acidimicrobiia bacterium]